MINSNNIKTSEKTQANFEKQRVVFTTQQLFDSGNEIIIEHQGSEYRLRITSNNKLILTK